MPTADLPRTGGADAIYTGAMRHDARVARESIGIENPMNRLEA